jgi:OmpA-OmpF porin, OOP family
MYNGPFAVIMKRYLAQKKLPRHFRFSRHAAFLLITAFLITLLSAAAGWAANKLSDFKDFKDPELFTRLPNYYLPYASSFKEQQFGSYSFQVTDAGKNKKQQIEGHFTTHCYAFDRTAGAMPGPLQIIRNYQQAAKNIGGTVLYDGPDRTTLRINKNGRETWAEVTPGGENYYVRIVERQIMQQQVTANADAMMAGLAQSGHVEVPGIFFDFNKADIKPESEPALLEVAKLLKANSALRVWVVGHTDYVGPADTNVTLAKARAASVVLALTQKHGIDAKRLIPYGVGPYAPVAANTSDEGRAKNRRVELVAQP